MGNPLEDLFSGMGIDGRSKAQRAQDTMKDASEHLAEQRKKEPKRLELPQLRQIRHNGVRYIRAEDVGSLVAAITDDPRLKSLIRKLKEI